MASTHVFRGGLERITVFSPTTAFVADIGGYEAIASFPDFSNETVQAGGRSFSTSVRRAWDINYLKGVVADTIAAMKELGAPVHVIGLSRGKSVMWLEDSSIIERPELGPRSRFAPNIIELFNGVYQAAIFEGEDMLAGFPWICTTAQSYTFPNLPIAGAGSGSGSGGSAASFAGGEGEALLPEFGNWANTYTGPAWEAVGGLSSIDASGVFTTGSAQIQFVAPLGSAVLKLTGDNITGTLYVYDQEGTLLTSGAEDVEVTLPCNTWILRVEIDPSADMCGRPRLEVVNAGRPSNPRFGDCVDYEGGETFTSWDWKPCGSTPGPELLEPVWIYFTDGATIRKVPIADPDDFTNVYTAGNSTVTIGQLAYWFDPATLIEWLYFIEQSTDLSTARIMRLNTSDDTVEVFCETGLTHSDNSGCHVRPSDGQVLFIGASTPYQVDPDGDPASISAMRGSSFGTPIRLAWHPSGGDDAQPYWYIIAANFLGLWRTTAPATASNISTTPGNGHQDLVVPLFPAIMPAGSDDGAFTRRTGSTQIVRFDGLSVNPSADSFTTASGGDDGIDLDYFSIANDGANGFIYFSTGAVTLRRVDIGFVGPSETVGASGGAANLGDSMVLLPKYGLPT